MISFTLERFPNHPEETTTFEENFSEISNESFLTLSYKKAMFVLFVKTLKLEKKRGTIFSFFSQKLRNLAPFALHLGIPSKFGTQLTSQTTEAIFKLLNRSNAH